MRPFLRQRDRWPLFDNLVRGRQLSAVGRQPNESSGRTARFTSCRRGEYRFLSGGHSPTKRRPLLSAARGREVLFSRALAPRQATKWTNNVARKWDPAGPTKWKLVAADNELAVHRTMQRADKMRKTPSASALLSDNVGKPTDKTVCWTDGQEG